MNQQRTRESFTLIELLLVIGVIAILSSIVIIAVNPTAQLAKARDAKRAHNVEQLQKAVTQYQLANGGFPPAVGSAAAIPTGFGNSLPICKTGITTDATCVNLDAVAPTYIAELPQDDSETNANYTGYKITKKDDRPLVTSTYMAGSVLTTGLVAYWKLDETSGTTALDSSDNGMNGAISNVTFQSAAPKTSFPNPGSFYFTGAGYSNVFLPASQLTPFTTGITSATTWSGWFTTTDTSGSYGQIPVFALPYFHILPGGKFRPLFYNSAPTYNFQDSTTALVPNTWYHLAATYDGTIIKGYINGKLETQAALSGPIYSAYAYGFLIGEYWSPGYAFYRHTGYIDDLRVYNRALSAAEIAMIAAGTN